MYRVCLLVNISKPNKNNTSFSGEYLRKIRMNNLPIELQQHLLWNKTEIDSCNIFGLTKVLCKRILSPATKTIIYTGPLLTYASSTWPQKTKYFDILYVYEIKVLYLKNWHSLWLRNVAKRVKFAKFVKIAGNKASKNC